MVDINTVMELKKKVKKLEQEKDRSKGRVDQLLKTLEEKFDCTNIKQAQELLKKKEKELKKLDSEYEAQLNSFMEKWGDKLDIE